MDFYISSLVIERPITSVLSSVSLIGLSSLKCSPVYFFQIRLFPLLSETIWFSWLSSIIVPVLSRPYQSLLVLYVGRDCFCSRYISTRSRLRFSFSYSYLWYYLFMNVPIVVIVCTFILSKLVYQFENLFYYSFFVYQFQNLFY